MANTRRTISHATATAMSVRVPRIVGTMTARTTCSIDGAEILTWLLVVAEMENLARVDMFAAETR